MHFFAPDKKLLGAATASSPARPHSVSGSPMRSSIKASPVRRFVILGDGAVNQGWLLRVPEPSRRCSICPVIYIIENNNGYSMGTQPRAVERLPHLLGRNAPRASPVDWDNLRRRESLRGCAPKTQIALDPRAESNHARRSSRSTPTVTKAIRVRRFRNTTRFTAPRKRSSATKRDHGPDRPMAGAAAF